MRAGILKLNTAKTQAQTDTCYFDSYILYIQKTKTEELPAKTSFIIYNSLKSYPSKLFEVVLVDAIQCGVQQSKIMSMYVQNQTGTEVMMKLA